MSHRLRPSLHQRAVHTVRSMNVEGSTEWEKSGRTVRHGGIKTRSSRTVRKVTTVTRGEQSVTSESVMSYSSDGAQRYPAVAHDKRSLKFRVVDDKVGNAISRLRECQRAFSHNLRSRVTSLVRAAEAAAALDRCPNIGASPLS